jgi:hypothetical protein
VAVCHRLISKAVVYARLSAALTCGFPGRSERLGEVIGTSLGEAPYGRLPHAMGTFVDSDVLSPIRP